MSRLLSSYLLLFRFLARLLDKGKITRCLRSLSSEVCAVTTTLPFLLCFWVFRAGKILTFDLKSAVLINTELEGTPAINSIHYYHLFVFFEITFLPDAHWSVKSKS